MFGSRVVSLSLLSSLFWLNLLVFAWADSSNESPEAPAPRTEVAAADQTPNDEATTTVAVEVADSNHQAAEEIAEPSIHRIGATTTVTEVSSGLPFPARVDTGARICAIHYEELQIEDPAEEPKDNVGKRVRILLKNSDGEQEWVSTKIVDYVTVRTTTDDDERYKVQLRLRWQDLEKRVAVTLSDRERMKYPLLLGRNFLRGDFLVDVNLDGEK
jgi:hypothetical protein